MNFIILLQQVENATAISGGDDIGECLSKKVTSISRRDVNCANTIGKFINFTVQGYDY